MTVASAVIALYLYNLTAVGVLGPDEPRYVAIGVAMARTGDWITPRLWGTPWFEKPPLVYWLTAIATQLGAGPDLAGRLPIALMSLLFLAIFFVLLRREWGVQAAAAATGILATTAGWLAYSDLCLTDVPVAICFALAALLCLPVLRPEPEVQTWRWLAIGAALGCGVLAKGLVPIALAVPWLWFLRRYWRRWWLVAAGLLVIALPWYSLVYARNGYPFIEEFIIRHHVQRLYSASLQHVQPAYYYIPILLAGLFPWTPALAFLFSRETIRDERRRFLLGTVLFGLLFFSASLNKLPGYVLPLFPLLAVLIGAHFETRLVSRTSRLMFFACAVCIACIPLLAAVLPPSLAGGKLSLRSFGVIDRTTLFYILLPVAIVFLARRAWLAPTLVLALVAGGIFLKTASDPVLEQQMSARGLWRELGSRGQHLCDAGTNRDWIYGLSFYRGDLIGGCAPNDGNLRVRSSGHKQPTVQPQ